MMLEKVQKATFKPLYFNSHQSRQSMAESKGEGEKTRQDCWALMTRAEKVLLFLLILSLGGILALSAFIINHFLNEKNCDTPQCIEASHKLIETIDFDANPCTELHQFVCGNYIPYHKEKKVDLVTDDLQEDESSPLKAVKGFYQACINESAINEDNEISLATLIWRMGGWPLFMGGHWKEENFNWLRYMADMRRYGVKTDWLFSFDYYEENGTNLLLINPPPISRRFRADYYYEIIAQLAKKLGESRPVEDDQLNKMISFETELYKISNDSRKRLSETRDDRIVSVSSINKVWPENVLSETLNKLSRGYAVFTNSTQVALADEKYIYFLNKLLGSVTRRTLANYFVWKTIETFLPYLSDEIREVYGKYVDLGSRKEHCHTETIRRFHSVVEEEYVKKYKSEKTPILLNSIANLTYQSYNQSDEARARVVIEGPEGIASGVTNIEFKSNKIIRMITDIQFHIENEFYKCLYKQADTCIKEGYYEDTKQLETYFDTSDRTIHLPYNLVYSDSFMWDQPNYINFAKIGRIIGDKIIEAEEEKYNTTINKVGVNLAYEGYIKWVQIDGMERKLPVLNFTIKQLFWIHSSSMYCSSEDDSDKFEEVAQSQYFKQDFQC